MKIIRLNDQQIKEILREHIICGDSGDGVPNFLSPDNCLMEETKSKQKSISKEKLKFWKTKEPEEVFTTQQMRGYKRNEELVNLSKIPSSVVEDILSNFKEPFKNDRSRIMGYFMKHGLKKNLESIAEF